MIQVTLSSAAPQPFVAPGIYAPYHGETVYDALLDSLADVPAGCTVLGAWEFETGAIVQQPVADFADITGGALRDLHLFAGQAPRSYS